MLDPCVPIIPRSVQGAALTHVHTQAKLCVCANNKQTLPGQVSAHRVAGLNPDMAYDNLDQSIALFVIKANLKATR